MVRLETAGRPVREWPARVAVLLLSSIAPALGKMTTDSFWRLAAAH